MSRKNINYVGKLFKCDGKPKLWEELQNGFDLQGQLLFIYNQIIHSISRSWKDALMTNSKNIKNLVCQGHHIIKNHQIYRKKLCSILIESNDSKPPQQNVQQKCFSKFKSWLENYLCATSYSHKRFKSWIISIQTFKKRFISK